MYARRNAITIGFLWVVIMTVGILFIRAERSNHEILKKRNVELSEMLDGSLAIARTLSSAENKYEILKAKWNEAPKIILSVDEPSFSLYYLNWLVDHYDLGLEFDFVLDKVDVVNDILSFSFTLSGEGLYRDIYDLVFFLTKNPLLYQIESFSLGKGRESTDNTVTFRMKIKGFSLIPKWDSKHEFDFANLKPVVQTSTFHDVFRELRKKPRQRREKNMFRTSVASSKPKVKKENYTNIERSSLQAVTNNSIYLKDSSGKLITLKIGDRVHLGRLSSIDQGKSEAEFTLEKDGVSQKITLGLGYSK